MGWKTLNTPVLEKIEEATGIKMIAINGNTMYQLCKENSYYMFIAKEKK